MSYEKTTPKNVERRDLIDTAYEKARGVIEKDEISLEAFRGLYSSEMINRDTATIQDREEEFAQEEEEKKEAKRLADIMEAIIFEQGELSDWFGPNATTIKTSRFDDIINGIDGVVEFNTGEGRDFSHAAFGLDATYSQDLAKKFRRLRGRIDSDELTQVKYFHSEDMRFKGMLRDLPMFIINAQPRTIMDLSELWLAGGKEEKEDLAKHPIQYQILFEIKEQCQVVKEYAKTVYGENHKAVEPYQRIEGIITNILKQKGEQDEINLEDLQFDRSYQNLLNTLEDIFKLKDT